MGFNTIQATKYLNMITITLDRLPQKNSLNHELLTEINEVLDIAEGDQEVKIIIIEGQKGIFCTGMDFQEATNGENRNNSSTTSYYIETLRRFSTIPKVIISKVEGQAMAGGIGLIAASDLVVAIEGAQFSLSEALWGLLPCMVIPYLIRRVGFQKAYSLTLTTMAINGEEAKRIHLVDEVDQDPDGFILKYSQRLSKLEGETIAHMKEYFRSMWILNEDMEQAAVNKLTELMSNEKVQQNISNFVKYKKFPWD